MTHFLNRDFGGRHRRPAIPPAGAPVPGGRIEKGFGKAGRIESVFGPLAARLNLGRPAHQVARRNAAEAPTQAPGPRVSPAAFGIFLLGPGSGDLGKVLDEFAPHLDESSGDLLHWIVPGHPLSSRPEFRAYLEAAGICMDTLVEEWNAARADRGSDDDVVADETARLAKRFGLGVGDMPTVVFVFPAQPEGEPMPVRLGSGGPLDAVEARIILDLLRKEVSLERLRAKVSTAGTPSVRALVAALKHQIGAFLAQVGEALPAAAARAGDVKAAQKALAWLAILSGETVDEGAKLGGVTRQTMYEDKTYGPLCRAITQERRASPGSPPRGSREGGDTEAEERDGDRD